MNCVRIVAFAWAAATAFASNAAPACALLSQADAQRLLDAPVAAPKEQAPRTGDGHVISTCRYLPVGHDPQDPLEPPAHGLEVSVHALKTAELARARHRWSRAQADEIRLGLGGAAAGGRVSEVDRLGDAAFVIDRDASGTAQVYVLKGVSMVRVQAWKAGGSATSIGTAAARQIVAGLP